MALPTRSPRSSSCRRARFRATSRHVWFNESDELLKHAVTNHRIEPEIDFDVLRRNRDAVADWIERRKEPSRILVVDSTFTGEDEKWNEVLDNSLKVLTWIRESGFLATDLTAAQTQMAHAHPDRALPYFHWLNKRVNWSLPVG